MESKLTGRSLLTICDLSDDELCYILDLADKLKKRRKDGIRGDLLKRKNVAMIFDKMSTRTRCATTIAMSDEGGNADNLSSFDTHFGKKESVVDTAKVLGRMFDGILYRGFKQSTVDLLSEHSGIPVINGLTDESHPTQALADLMTIREKFGKFNGVKVVYIGDGRNNVANSLMFACAKVGINFVNCTPLELMPDDDLLRAASKIAAKHAASVSVENDPKNALPGANVVYTDVWVSMGEESKSSERMEMLQPYQVNMKIMELSGNIESDNVILMHCLPAFHDKNTDLTKDSGALEITDEVFNASFSVVFDEAENRMHTIKAIFVATLT